MVNDVNKYRVVAFSAALLLSIALHGQISAGKLTTQITLDRNDTRIDSFLNRLSRQTGIGFSFNSKRISPARLIHLKKGRYTIAECLEQIKRTAGIHYAVMSNHIILVDEPPQEKYRLNLPAKAPASALAARKTSASKPVAKKATISKQKDTTNQGPILHLADSINRRLARQVIPKHPDTSSQVISIPIDTSGSQPVPINIDTIQRLIDSPLITKLPAPATPPGTTSKKQAAYAATKRSANSALPQAAPARIKEKNDNDHVMIGAAILRPDIYNLVGVGFNVQYERYFSPKFSWTGAVGYHYIIGEYKKKQRDTFSLSADTISQKDFAQIPILAGLRYYVVKPLYVAFEAGWSVKASSDVASFFTIAPSAGVKIPAGNSAIDINVRYLYNSGPATIPEKPRLQKGDFGLWSLRVAWAF